MYILDKYIITYILLYIIMMMMINDENENEILNK
jgi:hypothetical protein